MLAAALQAEVDACIERFAGERGADGRRLVVRNGTAEPRTIVTGAGPVEVTAPRVNDKRTDPATGERRRFSSAILPPWARKTPQVSEVLPLLYLHGLSSGDFVPALSRFLGSSAGLSAPVITKLTGQWKGEARAFMQRDLSGTDYVYVWADGIRVNIRLEEARLCLLVMIGVRIDAARSSSLWPTATASRRNHGLACCGTAPAAACAPPCSRWATGRSASGARSATCSRRRESSAAGSARSPTFSTRCPSLRIPGRRRPCRRSGTRRARTGPARP
jgi:hypothetical protein